MPFDSWKCPKCGYRITDIEIQGLRFDHGCPRCKTPLAEFTAIPADKQEPCLTLVCDRCGRIEHEPYDEGDLCWDGCGRFRIKDKQESTCPACGRSWDVSRFNSCECGASLADKQEEK